MKKKTNKRTGSPKKQRTEQDESIKNVRSLLKGITELQAQMAKIRAIQSKDNITSDAAEMGFPKSLVDAAKKSCVGDSAEQNLVNLINSDGEDRLTASSYGAAMILANSSKRQEVVLPYLLNWFDMFYEVGFPVECHERMREIFAAVIMYARVPTSGYKENAGVMTHLDFALPGYTESNNAD